MYTGFFYYDLSLIPLLSECRQLVQSCVPFGVVQTLHSEQGIVDVHTTLIAVAFGGNFVSTNPEAWLIFMSLCS